MELSSDADSGADARQTVYPVRRSELLLIFAFWTALAALTAANRLIDPRGPGPFATIPASAPITLAFVESYLWALLTVPIFWLTSRFSIERGSRVGRLLLFLAVGLVIAIGVDAVTNAVRAELFPPPRRRGFRGGGDPGFLIGLRRMWFLNDLLMYSAVLLAGVARDILARYRARQEESVRLAAHAAQLQAQLAEARLDVLRTQLNPHFLFNTLNAVSALVERDPRGVRRMIARLSELLRSTLDGSGEQEITVARELELLRLYLDIMEIRFQGTLVVEIDVDDEVRDALVPNLVLQPLVENAVKHGVSRLERDGRIAVRGRRVGDELVLSVCDNGPPAEASAASAEGSGVGLRNTRARLEQLYGSAQRLVLRSHPDGGMVAELALPYHTRTDLRQGATGSAHARPTPTPVVASPTS